MNEIAKEIIDAIIKKSEAACPNSLALIGLYGSVATGDTHEKSDLDLMILINDENGWQLADTFILNDVGIGYDMYCTTWEMLEEDAECNHAYLSKLMDSRLVYVREANAVQRLEELRKKALDILSSDVRYQKAQAAFDNAKKIYADCFLSDSVSQIRTDAGLVIYFLLDAVMLYHGRYFRKGMKRTFEELESLNIPFNTEEKVMNIIRAETNNEIRNGLTNLMRTMQAYLLFPHEKAAPNQDNIAGTYEEMFSNWRNKMQEASDRRDLFSAFMNMASFQCMMNEIAEHVAVNEFEIMNSFDPHDLEKNAKVFDHALDRYLEEYCKAGISPKRFADVDDFIVNYLEIV